MKNNLIKSFICGEALFLRDVNRRRRLYDVRGIFKRTDLVLNEVIFLNC